MLLLHLVIAHLLGDFVFQSDRLIQKKYRHWGGVLQHASIVTIFNILAIFPFWKQREAWWIIAIIFVVHFVQDVLKVGYEKRYNQKKRSTWPFFLDQIFHFALMICLVTQIPLQGMEIVPDFAGMLIKGWLAGLIVVTYVWEITLYQFKRKAKKSAKLKFQLRAMLGRLAIFTALFGLGCLALI